MTATGQEQKPLPPRPSGGGFGLTKRTFVGAHATGSSAPIADPWLITETRETLGFGAKTCAGCPELAP
jgi:hypothetical protein